MGKKMNQKAIQERKRKRLVKNSEKDERYSYTEDKHDRRADLGHDFSVKTGLKYASKSDEEHDEEKSGKVRKDQGEW